MAQLNPLADLDTEPITRQTLFDMWSTAKLTSVASDELAEGFLPIQVGSTFSDSPADPVPGQLYWHQSENVMYCYFDEIDGTGVSLWLAIGPDKFETACLADEPLAAGDPVTHTVDRRVRRPIGPDETGRGLPVTMGFVQSGFDDPETVNEAPYGGETTASGAWCRVGVDGLLYAKIENALSHPTQAWVQWTNAALLVLDPSATLPPGPIEANSPSGPSRQMIGISTQHVLELPSGTVTEPTYVFKFMFTPRVGTQSLFSG